MAACFFTLTGEEDVDLAGELVFDSASLDLDLDLDLFFLGVLDLLLAGGGERDFDRCFLTGLRFLLPGDRDRLLAGDLDLVRLRGDLDLRALLDLDRRLRFPAERDLDLLALCVDLERDLRDLGGGDRRCLDRLLDRLPPARLTGERVLDLRTPRLDLDRDLCNLATERDRERLLAAPRLGDRLLDFLPLPRDLDLDLRFLLGDPEGDLRLVRLGDLDSFLLGDGEVLRCFGDTDLFLDLGDLETFFLGVTEREVERDLRDSFFSGLGDWD